MWRDGASQEELPKARREEACHVCHVRWSMGTSAASAGMDISKTCGWEGCLRRVQGREVKNSGYSAASAGMEMSRTCGWEGCLRRVQGREVKNSGYSAAGAGKTGGQ